MLRRTFLSAAACGIVSGQSRSSRPPDYADVAYGRYRRNVLDFWRGKSQLPAPLVVYLHGGEFMSGDKSSLEPEMLDALLGSGISVAAINYRYCIEGAPYPFPMLESARAVQFLRYRAKEWNLDFQRFAAAGDSAGGGIALWLGLHDDVADRRPGDPVAHRSSRLSVVAVRDAQTTYDPQVIRTIIGVPAAQHPALGLLFGIAGNRPLTQSMQELISDASPVTHVSADDPPVLLVYSEPDVPVVAGAVPGTGIHHPRFGYHLKERMDKAGLECKVMVKEKPASTEAMVEFLKHHLLEM